MGADGPECTQPGNKSLDQLEIIIGFLAYDVQIVTDSLFTFYFSKLSLLA
jgi:hypothetical protein